MSRFDYTSDFDYKQEFNKNIKLAKQASDYIASIISKAKQENKEINEKLKNKNTENEIYLLLGNRHKNSYAIRVFKHMMNDIAPLRHTGEKPYDVIERNSIGFKSGLDKEYETLNQILNQMSDFNLEEYYDYLEETER